MNTQFLMMAADNWFGTMQPHFRISIFPLGNRETLWDVFWIWKIQESSFIWTDLRSRHPLVYSRIPGLSSLNTIDCLNFFRENRGGFFAAGSFASFQQATFNFGRNPFKYPPKGEPSFQSFNSAGGLEEDQKVILPKHIRLRQLHSISLKEDCCSLCFYLKSSIELQPCGHRGFCEKCSLLIETCPLCRVEITQRVTLLDIPDSIVDNDERINIDSHQIK